MTDFGGAHEGRQVCERFTRKQKLGEGGMGVVYRAHDNARRIDVALKTLHARDGAALQGFKNEFRALADIVHPNLVTLYELQATGDEWFFTMELVDGVTFLEAVRPHAAALASATSSQPNADATQALASDVQAKKTATLVLPDSSAPAHSGPHQHLEVTTTIDGPSSPPPSITPAARARLRRSAIRAATVDVARLRDAAVQLARGVRALHTAGKLHCDLKPSNVLVDNRGRVVVCDFGLVGDRRTLAATSGATVVRGTPAYMSPEQARGDALLPASDWYAVGVMIYEALAGDMPFSGDVGDVLARKQVEDAPPPRTHGGSAAPDLEGLCRDLLRRDPAARPGAEEVMRRLGAADIEAEPRPPGGTHDAPFVGRRDELAALGRALADSRAGKSVTALVHGPSGMGKSALVRRFLDDLPQSGVLVLEGRCYERENMPYKALDAIVDALTAHLVARSEAEVRELLPRDTPALARLFPALRRVPTIAAYAPPVTSDPHELRQRAFRALRFLLQGLGARGPTVLYIDDLQWGDLDSAPFLLDLVHHPRSPAVLFVGSYRTDEAATSALLRALLRREAGAVGDLRQISLAPLDESAAQALALGTLGDRASDESVRTLAARVSREAGGSPFFIVELAQAGSHARRDSGLAELLDERLSRLPAPALAMLTACAVAGRPVASRLLSGAAGIEDEATALVTLQAEHLVRTRRVGGEELVEPYHDWIRSVATRRLPEPELRRVHRRLARAFESAGAADPLALVEHWIGAGDEDKAASYALHAAEQAEVALAFDRAAYYYRRALVLAPPGTAERRALQIRLGNALANSGSLSEAASVYLDATVGADREVTIELERRALEQLLRGGDVEAGLVLARQVLAHVGLEVPGSRSAALAKIALGRAKLALTRRRLRERPAPARHAELVARADVCWSVSSSFSLVDPVLGMLFQTRQLGDALASGDPYRASIALALELGFVGTSGGKTRRKVEALARATLGLAEQSGSRAAVGFAIAMRGFAACLSGDFASGYEDLWTGERIMSEESTGLRWQIDVCRLYRIGALLYLGRFDDLTQLVPMLLREALERGDEYLATGLRTWRGSVAWLALDQPDEARRHANAGLRESRDPAAAFHLQDYYRWHSRAQIELYAGDSDAAWGLLEEGWSRLERSMLLRIQSVRIEGQFLRARCALATSRERPEALAIAEASARAIERERMAWSEPIAALVRAAVANARGDRSRAQLHADVAARGFASASMGGLAAVARHFAGRVLGGEVGGALQTEAEAWLATQKVRTPARLIAMYTPGA